MGNNILDWILPLRYSPCCRHDDPESDFSLGEDFVDLKRLYGLD
jgi:palmitoyltransferase